MTASRRERVIAAVACAAAALLAGCASPPGAPAVGALEPMARRPVFPPDDADYAARDAAVASLLGDPAGASAARARLDALDQTRESSGEAPTGLAPFAQDAANAALPTARERRKAARALTKRSDLDPALRARLDEELADDPLELASDRLEEAHIAAFGTTFNAIAEPLGRSVTNPMRALPDLVTGILGLAVKEHLSDELSLQERQALAQWKRFVAMNPDAPETPALRERIADYQSGWNRTQRDRQLRLARHALSNGQAGTAYLAATRALQVMPEDADALELRAEAERRLAEARAARARSLEAGPSSGPLDAPSHDFAIEMLRHGGDLGGTARRILQTPADARDARSATLRDVARYSLATADGEAGREVEMWQELQELAAEPPERSSMARHAQALVSSPEENPERAFELARSADTRRSIGWLLFGSLAEGPPDMDLPRPLEWLIEVPNTLEIATGLPNRLIRYPWLDDPRKGRAAAAFGRRYLARRPDGVHAEEVRSWLVDFERSRGNYAAAVELAQQDGASAETLAPLREQAAAQLLKTAQDEKRRDARQAFLRHIAADYSDTESGRKAGNLARTQVLEASPQRIRISRGYLQENPAIAGEDALGLRPELIDGKLGNGELHPDGVVLAGGSVIEFRYVAPGGSEDDPPEVKRQRVSPERMARIVSVLEETAERNALVDPDATFAADAERDRFFEQARLGLLDEPDLRATAESSYAFRSMREQYGLVRTRESILPVDLVLQGSFPSLGLGAFPRIRMPKQTPDAFLYK
ncbi:MAG TPA: hypothetical protein VMW35_20795 [Myxococcota bacterium]|nr:hypothetical protein [Myxococcota bacterium]